MGKIKITKLNVLQDKNYAFIPLGNPDKIFGKGGVVRLVRDKIFRQNKDTDTSEFWATLGRADDGNILNVWGGAIECSNKGNDDFTNRGALIQDEIKLIQSIFPNENPNQGMVFRTMKERYISFDGVSFSNVPGARSLRLTVLVKADEHAVVFLQHTDDEDDNSQEGVIEYITPEQVEDLGKRDRLTYLFDVPDQHIDQLGRFVLKVVTFKRDVKKMQSTDALDKFFRGLDNTYGFCVYNPTKNIFSPIDPAAIDRKAKTLFLLHGTFSTVIGSYGDLLTNGWLRKVIDTGKYQQVIGFDHLTVFDSPMQNAAVFFSLLQPGGKFAKNVDVVTTSRGGLVGKCIVNDKQQKLLTAERVATVACANGVQYINTGKKIERFLSIMKKLVVGPGAKLIVGLAANSCDYILTRSGLKIMGIGNNDLEVILKDKPANSNMRYYPLCGDLVAANHPHTIMPFIDTLISVTIMGPHHDWVVGTDYQVLMPSEHYAYSKTKGWNVQTYRNQPIDSIHVRYFDNNMTMVTKDRIFEYLHDSGPVL
jgi:hypothetical protein